MSIRARLKRRPEATGGERSSHIGRVFRRTTLAFLFLGVVAGVGIALTAIALLRAETPLRHGRDALERGRSALLRGDAAAAGDAFAAASTAFMQAERTTHGSLERAAGVFPLIGRNVEVADRLAVAGLDLARAGAVFADALGSIPGGISALAPTSGGVPLDSVAAVTPSISQAAALANAASAELVGSSSSLLLPPVARARTTAVDSIGSAAKTLLSASALLKVLPEFAGANGARRYFFGAQDPAELRGTGGLIGAYAVATFDEGRLTFSPFRPTTTLPDVPADAVPAPSPDFRRNYDQYGGAGDWSNINLTPDFPTAARAIQTLYELDTHEHLDGVIAADPVLLQQLLKVTGPTEVPEVGSRIDADNVINYTENLAFSVFETSKERKTTLGGVAANVISRFVAMQGRGLARIRAVVEPATAGHLLVYSSDPVVEGTLEHVGASGALRATGNVLSVVVNSASGSKVDYWAHRTVSYGVQLNAAGGATAATGVTITNDAPKSGHPVYSIGPFPRPSLHLQAGDQRSLVTVYCGPRCTPYAPARNGSSVEVRTGSELGYRWVGDFPTIPSGHTSTFRVSEALDDAWAGTGAGGTYTATVLGQATTRPTHLTLRITAPPGMSITWTSVPMHVEGSTATWQGDEPYRMTFEVAFAPPLPLRVWRSLIDRLT
jgi:hypothetical protein